MSDYFSALIEQGSDLSGKLAINGSVRVAGEIQGEVFCNDSVYIVEGAEVKANIKAKVIIIEGNVIGDLQANGRLEIRSEDYFEGNIKGNSLIVEQGATFKGTSQTNI